MHCDKHVVKMPTETAQLLSNVFHLNGLKGPYKPTHMKHPCTLWAAQSVKNFLWLSELGIALCAEYTKRYGRKHKCENIIKKMKRRIKELSFPKIELTRFALCMPKEYHLGNPVLSYRKYYIYEKSKFAKWKNGNIPKWYLA